MIGMLSTSPIGVVTAAIDGPEPSDFGVDAWWVILIKVVLLFLVLVLLTLFNIW